jgi:hypothetical protein
VLILHIEELLELRFGDELPTYEIVSEELPGVFRGRGRYETLSKIDLLVVRIALDGEGPRLSALGHPLQEICTRHRPQIATDRQKETPVV